MATFTVNTTAQLESVLLASKGGDTILLAPGQYDNAFLKGAPTKGTDTITSLDPSHPAVLTSLILNNSQNLTLTNLVFDLSNDAAQAQPFVVENSKQINLSYISLHGSMDNNPQDDTTALVIRNVTNISVTNSEFQQAMVGITAINDQHLTVSGNSFHDMRLDGIHVAGSDYVTVSKNYFTDFYPQGDPNNGGDHPDAIQFYTLNTTTVPNQISVTGNVIVRGAGAPIHGIFFDDEVGNLTFQNVSIKNNTIIGEGYDGIALTDVNAPQIASNTIQPYADIAASGIRLTNVTNPVLTSNQAGIYQYNAGVTGVTATSDTTAAITTPRTLLASTNTTLASNYHILYLTGFQNLTAVGNNAGDTIYGNEGSDNITGGTGADIIIGGQGNDVITGGAGNDKLTGGAGADTFIFAPHSGKDSITDFGNGADSIDISAYLSAGFTPIVTDASAGLTISFSTGDSIQLLGVHPANLVSTVTGFIHS